MTIKGGSETTHEVCSVNQKCSFTHNEVSIELSKEKACQINATNIQLINEKR